MKEKVREIFKSYFPGFILGIISVSIITVYAETFFPSNQTTYDNSVSGLKSENVQDAIDELYGVCFPPKAGDQILENAGLEKDPYECRYFFTGANPNNYITFNNEKAGWRIISIECDGTIKIIKEEDINSNDGCTGEWDDKSYSNTWDKTTLNKYLNETYYNSFTEETKAQIVLHDWNIGIMESDYENMLDQINAENSTKWQAKIALITVSEYLRTNSDNNCLPVNKYNSNFRPYNDNLCLDTTWISDHRGSWSLTKKVDPYNQILPIYYSTTISTEVISMFIHPTLYLSPDIKITGGNGSQSNPFELSL